MRIIFKLLAAGAFCVGLPACRKARAPEVPPPAAPEQAAVSQPSNRFTSLDAQDNPERTLLGSWEVSSAATLEANTALSQDRLRELRSGVLPSLAGVTMTYQADGTTITTARGSAPVKGTWKTVKAAPPRLTVELKSPGGPPVNMTVEVVRLDLIQTEMTGFVVVLRRAGAVSGEVPTSAARVPRARGSPAGATAKVEIRQVAVGTDPGLSNDNGRILEENRKVQDQNRVVHERNRKVEEQNRQMEEQERKRDAPLYIK